MKRHNPSPVLPSPCKSAPSNQTTSILLNIESYSNHLAAMVESSEDAIISRSLDGIIRSWNRAGEKMFGYTAEQAIGKNIAMIIPDELLNFEANVLSRILNNETVEHYETVRNNKKGERFFVSVSVSALKDRNGSIIGVSKIARDISYHKQAAEEIKILNDQLENRASELLAANKELIVQAIEKEKKAIELDIAISDLNFSALQYQEVNKELESFSYSVSHDLRAPLRAVNGYAKMLFENYESSLDSEGNRLVNKIVSNAKKMGQLIDDLLSFSRTGRKELTKINIDMFKMITNICDEFKSDLNDRDVHFDIQFLPNVFADAATMKIVWVNLVSNAIKYSALKKNSLIEIGAQAKDGKTVYYVKDNGAGFDMRYVGKLFGVFQRLHSEEEFEGTGVGLALVQRIVSKHGGAIWAEAELNKGAIFYFTL